MALSSFLRGVLRRLCAVSGARPANPCTHKDATLSRFIFDKRHFSISKKLPKPTAFLPPEDLQMSASWIDGLQDHEIWSMGDEARPKPSRARADFKVAAANDLELTVEPDPKPHPRHVNVCGWPPEKDKRMSIAQDLCAASMLQIRIGLSER